MWLDRLAAHAGSPGSTTPQPGSRPYSPVPRKASGSLSPYVTSQRPGISSRGSTTSLISHDSSNSLLASSRKPNGSGLKQSLVVLDQSVPLEALARVLDDGDQAEGQIEAEPRFSVVEADLELDFEFGGLSLKDLATSQVTNQTDDASRRFHTSEDCPCHPVI